MIQAIVVIATIPHIKIYPKSFNSAYIYSPICPHILRYRHSVAPVYDFVDYLIDYFDNDLITLCVEFSKRCE
jgi:hypothetical protein